MGNTFFSPKNIREFIREFSFFKRKVSLTHELLMQHNKLQEEEKNIENIKNLKNSKTSQRINLLESTYGLNKENAKFFNTLIGNGPETNNQTSLCYPLTAQEQRGNQQGFITSIFAAGAKTALETLLNQKDPNYSWNKILSSSVRSFKTLNDAWNTKTTIDDEQKQQTAIEKFVRYFPFLSSTADNILNKSNPSISPHPYQDWLTDSVREFIDSLASEGPLAQKHKKTFELLIEKENQLSKNLINLYTSKFYKEIILTPQNLAKYEKDFMPLPGQIQYAATLERQTIKFEPESMAPNNPPPPIPKKTIDHSTPPNKPLPTVPLCGKIGGSGRPLPRIPGANFQTR
jgi:hypothetical protein